METNEEITIPRNNIEILHETAWVVLQAATNLRRLGRKMHVDDDTYAKAYKMMHDLHALSSETWNFLIEMANNQQEGQG